MQKALRSIMIWVGVLLIFYTSYIVISALSDRTAVVDYSYLVNSIYNGNVEELVVSDTNAKAVLSDGAKIRARIPSREVFNEDVGDELVRLMQDGKIAYAAEAAEISVWSVLTPALTIVLILFMIFFVMGNGSRGMSNFGRSRARLFDPALTHVTFKDVAGAKEEKEELEELVDFLREPQKFISLGARIPRGVLLVGPPGTGKTLLARAVAGEAGVPFFTISGSDFVEMYVGVGAARVRDLFEQAKRSNPCIIFIDEIDAVGRKRGTGMGGGHDEREQTLNQLLVEMDGFGKNSGVIVIAATNRPDILDPALLRPGRFDRTIMVDAPDVSEREKIIEIYVKAKPVAADVDIKKIARDTAGCTGAELENIINEAAIFAARRNKTELDRRDISDAYTKVLLGPEKRSHVMSDEEKRLTAYHEAGHALMVKLAGGRDKVSQISIVPRGRSGGHTLYNSDEEISFTTVRDILARISVALGGRAAEKLVLDDITTGASEDIKYATHLAHDMVTRFGMSERVGLISYDSGEEMFLGRDLGVSKTYSERTAAEIDDEVKSIISKQYNTALELLGQNRAKLDALADALIERETVTGAEFDKIIEKA